MFHDPTPSKEGRPERKDSTDVYLVLHLEMKALVSTQLLSSGTFRLARGLHL